ncbi:restriction endonuclease subunit S [Lysinibacillus fusiformis]|uniref:restriction endonuclease subunit S n=1 Tax=Lysinibacillus fusiformis TaxID=28031 RepID=UPI001E3805EC|nr:restriction endonuclease subunit S [Lysinibacillus fusiformis]MCE4045150.1 restriction endonuclease subunit S [Lysinibacillus fusiformis]
MTTPLKLSDRKWSSFTVEEIGDVLGGKDIFAHQREVGEIPYVGSSAINNGVIDFVGNDNNTKSSNILSVNRNGSVGYVFYHPYEAVFSGDTRRLKLKQYANNKYVNLFIATCLEKQKDKFRFGYKLGAARLKRQRIMLPVDEHGDIDWEFIITFMEQKYYTIKNEYENPSENKVFDERELKDLNWDQFKMDDIFIINSGVRLTKADMQPGSIPFIGATDSNNGITQFTSTVNASLDSNILGVNYNGSVVENFYHPYKAVFSDDVKRLKLKNYPNNKHVLLFMKAVILQQKVKYAYGYKFNATRMKEQIILLPTKEDGSPDYEFMGQYMKRIENRIIERISKKEANQ